MKNKTCNDLIEKCFVKCNDCGCLIQKGEEKEVEEGIDYQKEIIKYCKRCKPPYDKVLGAMGYRWYYRIGEFECNEKGEVYGIVKK